MTKIAILKRCHYWQKRLRLVDWDIDWQIVEGSDMEGGAAGRCSRWDKFGFARIKILKPSDIRNPNGIPGYESIDSTIVHELLHIILNPLLRKPDGDFEDDLQELAVERIAKAMVGI